MKFDQLSFVINFSTQVGLAEGERILKKLISKWGRFDEIKTIPIPPGINGISFSSVQPSPEYQWVASIWYTRFELGFIKQETENEEPKGLSDMVKDALEEFQTKNIERIGVVGIFYDENTEPTNWIKNKYFKDSSISSNPHELSFRCNERINIAGLKSNKIIEILDGTKTWTEDKIIAIKLDVNTLPEELEKNRLNTPEQWQAFSSSAIHEVFDWIKKFS